MKKALKNRKGFTLVELMVVVAIMGVLVAVAVPVYNNVTAKAELSTIKANLRIINSAIMQSEIDNVDLSTFNAGTANTLAPTYLQAWPTGPNGTTYTVTAAEPYQAVATLGDKYTDGADGKTDFAAADEVVLTGDYLTAVD